MSEQKQIPTVTEVRNFVNNPNLQIYTYYDNGSLHILSSNIFSQQGAKLGVPYKQGELVITMRNSPQEVDCYINQNGELIVNQPLGEDYSIDTDGNLIGTINI